MLQAIRDRTTGVIAWVIVGLIIVTFALWGVDSYLKDDSRPYVAKVNDIEISEAMVGRAMQRQRIQMQRVLGDRFDPSVIDESVLRENALQALIQKQLLVQAADAEGFAVSDQLLSSRIQSIPDVQVDGQFSMDRYESLLRQQGMIPAGFEADLRRDLLVQQFLSGLSNTVGVSDAQIDQLYVIQAQQRELEYLLLSAQAVADDVELTDADVSAYFEAHKDVFRDPEQIKLEYLELKNADLAESISVGEAQIQRFYERNQDRYGREEQRRARHILIQLAADADDASSAAARDKAQVALERLQAGEDFAALAAELSDDPGSAAQGGDLGFFGRGMMVPEFESATYALATGQRSELVKSPFGFHIIELTDIKPGDVKPLAEVRAQILTELRSEQLEDLFMDRAEVLTETSYEHPDTLGVAAEAVDLPIQESDWISRDGGAGLGLYPAVVSSAFSEDVLDAGNNSELVEVAAGHVVVLRVMDRKPAQYQALKVVRAEVESALRRERAMQLTRSQGEALRERVAAGETMADLATGVTRHQAAGQIQRSARNHPTELVAQAFRMPKPTADQPALSGLALANGDYAVLRVTEVANGDPANMSEAERNQARQSLMRAYAAVEVNALIEYLKAQAQIEVSDADQG